MLRTLGVFLLLLFEVSVQSSLASSSQKSFSPFSLIAYEIDQVAEEVPDTKLTCSSPTASMLRKLRADNPGSVEQEKIRRLLPHLEQEERDCESVGNLTEDEVEKSNQVMEKNFDEMKAKIDREAPEEIRKRSQRLTPDELGIKDDDFTKSRDYLDHTGYVGITSSWAGYIDGVLIMATGCRYNANPLQGSLFISKDSEVSYFENFYNSPSATGPLKIVSESGGILTLRSIGGTYEGYDSGTQTSSTFHAVGGRVYHFDLKKLRYLD